MVETMKANVFVPSHAEATKDMKELACLNREKVHEIARKLLSFLSVPVITEEIIKKVFDEYGLEMNFEQYVLVGSTIRSYLSWLRDTGRIDAVFEGNRLLWQRIG
ncbi:hypothetical protein SDC9_72795 [bioreactor metagenome]|uniref:Uncharacterized protein n=1 Tax=bioreactor metagenome TaxID=1076179 RepID=A0A644YJI9_9ZZZZ